MIGYSAADGLADPPSGVGTELVALGWVELFYGSKQADISLLYQIQEGDTPTHVALRHANDETQISPNEGLLGFVGQGFQLDLLQPESLGVRKPALVGTLRGQTFNFLQAFLQLGLQLGRHRVKTLHPLQRRTCDCLPGGVIAPHTVVKPTSDVGFLIGIPCCSELN